MKRYQKNAVIYCLIGIVLLIIGIIWLNLNDKTFITGVNMLSAGVAFEAVAIYFYIKHKKTGE